MSTTPGPRTSSPRTLAISGRAARRVTELLAAEPATGLMLRVAVSGGGCAGFQYGFSLDSETGPDDRTFSQHGVTIVVDDISLDLLAGGEIDFVEDLAGSAFRIANPNATSSCGCGTSFAVQA